MLKSILSILVFCTISLNCQEELNTTNVVGGVLDVDLNDPQKYAVIYQQAQFAAKEYTKLYKASLINSCSSVIFEPARIISAQVQVVSGKLYYINTEIKDANCQANCAIKTCKFEIYEVQWLKIQTLKESRCV
jgi:hypothetical protein